MPDHPNVLLIMTDQHRHDLMTCAGHDTVPTPNIDRIAARGVRFENAYCAYPVCVASRMAMLTGLYAHQTGAIDNDDYLDWRYRTMETAPEAISGNSFADIVRDPDQPGPDAVFSEYNLRSGNCQYMIRTQQHKYIHNDGSTDELYDLAADPDENTNRIDDAALGSAQQDLRARLFEWFDPSENGFRGSRG